MCIIFDFFLCTIFVDDEDTEAIDEEFTVDNEGTKDTDEDCTVDDEGTKAVDEDCTVDDEGIKTLDDEGKRFGEGSQLDPAFKDVVMGDPASATAV